MKARFVVLIFFSTLICLSPASSAETDPLRAFDQESIAGAMKLATILSGTTWIYHYEGKDYPFRFGISGTIERLKYWPNVHWRVVSPTEVLLDRPEGGSVVFRFNKDMKVFQCNDWNGKPASGSLDTGKSSDGSSGQSYFGTVRP